MVAAIQHHFWHFFQEIRTLTVNKHTTLVEIGLTKMWNEETNEAFLASQQNLADFVRLEERIVLWYYQRAWIACVTTTINTDILKDDNWTAHNPQTGCFMGSSFWQRQYLFLCKQ